MVGWIKKAGSRYGRGGVGQHIAWDFRWAKGKVKSDDGGGRGRQGGGGERECRASSPYYGSELTWDATRNHVGCT